MPESNTCVINGCLLLEGNVTCNSDITLTSRGKVIPVPDPDLTKSYYSLHTSQYTTANGGSRTMASTTGSIDIEGLIDGYGMGFESNRGPGANSLLHDSSGNDLSGYGATHAGLGYYDSTDMGIPSPLPRYGHHETPMSLGSGSGFYHELGCPSPLYGEDTRGGGGIKLVAKSGPITINGTINMNGQDGTHAGGGAGGSIWLNGWEIHGTGYMFAEGGRTYLDTTAGGGGGGYISIWNFKSNLFDGTSSVIGKSGAYDGKYFEKQTEPIIEDPFTGTILNTKWWDGGGTYSLDNQLDLSSPDGTFEPSYLESNFYVSGKEILASVDYAPLGPDASVYTAAFLLYADESNWFGLARRSTGIYGVSMADGLESASGIPYDNTDLSFRLYKNDGTFSFQYYDSTSIPQTIYTDYRPELADKNFKVKLVLEKEDPTESDFRTEYLRLTPLDISREYYSTDATASDTSAVAVNMISGTSQLYGLDFYVEGDKVKWDASGLSSFNTPFGLLVIDYFILSADDIARRSVLLSEIPSPSEIAVNVVHGPPQDLGPDFTVLNQRLDWRGRNLQDLLEVGDEVRVMYLWDPWNVPILRDSIEYGDVVRTMYGWDFSGTSGMDVAFDNVQIHDGIIMNAETTEPVLYVDPDYGSDSSSGTQLSPLKNLFVATAWARRGSTVVLYDGTHNPTYVARKDLTLRGAEGSKPLVTSKYVQDTTGSGWETNAISFYGCQGLVENLTLKDSTYGVRVEHGGFDVKRCDISDASVGIACIKCDPVIARNRIYSVTRGMDFTQALSPNIYSNVIFDASAAIVGGQVPDMTVASNTFDNNQIHLVLDTSSAAIVSNNSLTWGAYGIYASTDSWIEVYYNNFYPTPLPNIYNRAPDATAGNIYDNPLYYDRLGARDFHLNTGSPNIGTGSLAYDDYLYDNDGADRRQEDIGAYQFMADQTYTGDIYVSSHGDDFWNPGSIDEPFRTLDRAMLTSDSTVIIDGGHYDSFYLALSAKHIDINQLFIHLGPEQLFVSYMELSQEDINNGFVPLPSFVQDDEEQFVALNVVGGSTQEYNIDYIVDTGSLIWEGYELENFLDVGDVLRIVFEGPLQRKALNTFVLHDHYTNFEIDKAVYVSPSGSDSTDLGGDGTNSGGTGSKELPYRTIDMALSNSNPGDSIVAMAGEYPVFTSLDDRVLVPGYDKTAVQSLKYDRFYEDFFAPLDFRAFGWTQFDSVPWTMSYAGDSSVTNGGGVLGLTYDGTNTASAVSTFNVLSEYEVSAYFQNAVDPVKMYLTSQDNTAFFGYDGSGYTAGIITNGTSYVCSGDLTNGDGTTSVNFVTEYVSVNANNIRDKFVPLSYIPEPDCTNIALNVVGGVSQNLGEDFYLQDSKVKWDGMDLDGEIETSDVLRIIYMDRVLSDKKRAAISLSGQRLSVKIFDGDWRVINMRDISDTTSEWKVSFVMDEAADQSHDCIYGKGFVSKFLAMADGFTDMSLDKPLEVRTEKRNLIFYEERT